MELLQNRFPVLPELLRPAFDAVHGSDEVSAKREKTFVTIMFEAVCLYCQGYTERVLRSGGN
jgi:hypothetical protein